MLSLKEFQQEVKKHVKGQDEAVNTISTIMFKYLIRLHGSDLGLRFSGAPGILLHGISGSGKTYVAKQAAEIFGLPFIELNAKSISQEGWSGASFRRLIERSLQDEQKRFEFNIKGAVIFIDEFDKILTPNISSGKDDVSFHLQAGLLKYIEGFPIDLHVYGPKGNITSLDTSKCMFIFAGAFSKMIENTTETIGFHKTRVETKKHFLEKIINFGMLPELAGRIQEYVTLNEITDKMYKDILYTDTFVYLSWQILLNSMDLNFKINERKALEMAKASNLGVRGLIQAVEKQVTTCINKNIDNLDLDKLTLFDIKKSSL